MKLITRNIDYAIRALCVIAKSKGSTLDVKILAHETKIPRPFLRKILQRLNKVGLLESFKGKGGGFSLAKKADNITLLDLIECFQGSVKLCDHVFRKKRCSKIQKCCIKKKMDVIEAYIIGKLKSIAITSCISNS